MSEFVSEAQRMAAVLISKEIRAGESAEGALRRVAAKCGVTYHTLWQLRYRAPKRMFVDVFFAISKAHEAMCEQQRKKLEHEIRLREAAGRADAPLVSAARRLGGIDRT